MTFEDAKLEYQKINFDLNHNTITIGEYDKKIKTLYNSIIKDILFEFRSCISKDIGARVKSIYIYAAPAYKEGFEMASTACDASLDYFLDELLKKYEVE